MPTHSPPLAYLTIPYSNTETQLSSSTPQLPETYLRAKVVSSLKNQASGPIIVQQCKFLEEVYNTNITKSILERDTTCYAKGYASIVDSIYRKRLVPTIINFVDTPLHHYSLIFLW